MLHIQKNLMMRIHWTEDRLICEHIYFLFCENINYLCSTYGDGLMRLFIFLLLFHTHTQKEITSQSNEIRVYH